jgi:pimeloyl-ACP methyl ester carboxylesterase
VIPGAGSSGLVWAQVVQAIGATLLEVPDEPDVPAMAAALAPELRQLDEPRILVGASLGAMVSLELARSVHIDALVLIAAGFGIEVSDSLLQWIAADPPGLLAKVAKMSIAARDDEAMVELVRSDFASRGQPVLLGHLTALGSYRPEPPDAPPPTLVLWGVGDRSVPLSGHVELALQCRGAVVPLLDAGHMPYVERPAETVRWIRTAAQLLYLRTEEETSHGQRHHVSNLA